jgi:hypothetical protein
VTAVESLQPLVRLIIKEKTVPTELYLVLAQFPKMERDLSDHAICVSVCLSPCQHSNRLVDFNEIWYEGDAFKVTDVTILAYLPNIETGL